MYENYFGLKIKPFQIAPDLDFLFLSAKHKEAISCMEFGVMEDIGIILLTGEIGTGKTTLIRHILEGIENDIDVAAIYNTNLTSEQLIAAIMEAFGIDSHFENKFRAIKTIQTHLKSLRKQKRKPLLIIDDAQNLSLQTLEEIRLISNLQNSVRMLVQIILVGQPELEAKLGDPNASSLAQRVSISYHLLSFGKEETREYIIHRLKVAGGRTNIFTQSAMEQIYSATRGIPRAINLLCDNALIYAFNHNTNPIDAFCIKEVLSEKRSRATRPQNSYFNRSTRPSNPKPCYGSSSQHKNPNAPHGPDWQIEISRRMDALERFVTANTRELKALLKKERQRNDKLLIAYTHLKSKYDALQKTRYEREHLRANMTTRKSLARASGTERRVAQLVHHKK